MAGFAARSFIDFDVLDAFREALQADRTKVRRVFFVAITREGSAAEQMRRRLSTRPGRVVYADNGKLRWKSPKQRRYVMMLLREENNLPYQRRAIGIPESWTVTVDDPLDVLVKNSDPATRYVQGEDQQPYHIDTGWGYAPGIIREYANAITEDLMHAYLRFIVGYKA